ncbi:MAG: DUF2796 domain-containing protein [Lautropia sp.]
MERMTRQRQAILAAIESAARPLSPREVLGLARRSVPAIGIATVYRQIGALAAEGAIQPVSMPGESARFERTRTDHHHHFHCTQCDRVFEVDGCPGDMRGLAPAGFEVVRHDLTLYGHCRDCRIPDAAARTSRRARAPGSVATLVAIASVLALGAGSPAPVVAAPGAHRHGVSTMEIAVDGRVLDIRLETPLDDLVGFERAPRTPAEQAGVRRMATTLRDVGRHLVLPAQAGCTAGATTLESAVLDPSLLQPSTGAPGAAGAAGAPASDGHAEVVVNWRFECDRIDRLDRIEVKLFDSFAGIRQIDVQSAGPRAQKGTTLGPKRRVFRF